MVTKVAAIYEAGVFKPERPVELADHTRVQLVVESPDPAKTAQDPTGWKALDELIGFIKDGPEEPIGRDHDRYLYRK